MLSTLKDLNDYGLFSFLTLVVLIFTLCYLRNQYKTLLEEHSWASKDRKLNRPRMEYLFKMDNDNEDKLRILISNLTGGDRNFDNYLYWRSTKGKQTENSKSKTGGLKYIGFKYTGRALIKPASGSSENNPIIKNYCTYQGIIEIENCKMNQLEDIFILDNGGMEWPMRDKTRKDFVEYINNYNKSENK